MLADRSSRRRSANCPSGLLRGALTIPASFFLHSGEVLGDRPGDKGAPVLALPARLGGNRIQERLRKGDLDAPFVPRDHDWHPGALRQALPATLQAIPERRRRHRRRCARAAAMHLARILRSASLDQVWPASRASPDGWCGLQPHRRFADRLRSGQDRMQS